jgi:hypothetical protein
MNQTSDHEIISRYRRVKGSGLFEIDEFSAVTGYPLTRVLEIMENLELSGEVVRFGHGVYLLKPPAVMLAKASFRYDWQPQKDKLEELWAMLSLRKWTCKSDLRKKWKHSDTSLTRYLRALRLSGLIQFKKVDQQSYYQKSTSEIQLTASWQELTRRNDV